MKDTTIINHKPYRILIVKNRAMGDSVIGLSSISYIKSIFPNAKITYAIPSWITSLYKTVNGSFDEIFPIDFKNFSSWPNYFLSLRKKQFDLILELHQSGSSGKFLKLFSFLNQIPYSFHNHHGINAEQDKINERPSIQKDLDGIFAALKNWNLIKSHNPPNYLNFPPVLTLKNEISRKKNMIILGVVASKSSKLWPMSYFIKLMKDLNQVFLKKHPDLEFYIPLSKSSLDQKAKQELENLGPPANATIEDIPLVDLPPVFMRAICYIGNDTGVKHLAISLGIKSVTFFGPERPQEWHPYSLEKHSYHFIENLECRTQIYHYCPLSECESMICLKQIQVDDVLKTLNLQFL